MKCPTCPVAGPCYADHPSRGRLCQLIASGRGDYRDLVIRKSAGLAESPADTLRGPTPPPDRRVVASTFLNGFSGFGRFTWRLLEAAERQGVAVAIDPTATDERYATLPAWLASHAEPDAPEAWRLAMGYLGGGIPTDRAAVAFTMHEVGGIPGPMVAQLNQAHAVIVPTAWNAEVFRRCGVHRPVHVCPLGFDPAEGWAPGPVRDGGPFRALMVGMLDAGGNRKGFAEGVAAFLRAFPDDDGVELVVKVWPGCLRHMPALPMDRRIRVIAAAMPLPELVALYQSADVFLSPSYGEGWNLPLLEAMACGVPPVATAATAHGAFHGPDTGYVVKHLAEPARGYYAGHGDWFPPDVEHLAAMLRLARDEPGLRRTLAVGAVERARRLTWSDSARTLLAILRSAGMLAPVEGPRVALLRRAGKCQHRERCGCTAANCRKLGRKVTLDECAGCPELPERGIHRHSPAPRHCRPGLL
jgi:glycosyltransferase involved in cell wall biosynthesis